MSVNKTTYGIVGVNLSAYRDDIITDSFYKSEKYDNLTCYQREGKIQLFTDPMSGDYLYFGFIFFKGTDDCDENMSAISMESINSASTAVANQCERLFGIKKEPMVIVFNEFS